MKNMIKISCLSFLLLANACNEDVSEGHSPQSGPIEVVEGVLVFDTNETFQNFYNDLSQLNYDEIENRTSFEGFETLESWKLSNETGFLQEFGEPTLENMVSKDVVLRFLLNKEGMVAIDDKLYLLGTDRAFEYSLDVLNSQMNRKSILERMEPMDISLTEVQKAEAGNALVDSNSSSRTSTTDNGIVQINNDHRVQVTYYSISNLTVGSVYLSLELQKGPSWSKVSSDYLEILSTACGFECVSINHAGVYDNFSSRDFKISSKLLSPDPSVSISFRIKLNGNNTVYPTGANSYNYSAP